MRKTLILFALVLCLFGAAALCPQTNAAAADNKNTEIVLAAGSFEKLPGDFVFPTAAERDFDYWASIGIDNAAQIYTNPSDGYNTTKTVRLTAPGYPAEKAFGSCFNAFSFTKGTYSVVFDFKFGPYCAFAQCSFVGPDFEGAIWNLTDPSTLDTVTELGDGWMRFRAEVNLSQIRAEKCDSVRFLVGRAAKEDGADSVMYIDNVQILKGSLDELFPEPEQPETPEETGGCGSALTYADLFLATVPLTAGGAWILLRNTNKKRRLCHENQNKKR